jgi:DNA-binding IclR family transcriptional regulator
LQTLEATDWVRLIDGGRYELSFGLLPLLQPLARHDLLIELVREPLLRLSKDSGLTVKISVRQADSAVTLFRIESPRPTSVNARLGASFHLSLGSSGTVLMSALSDVERARLLSSAPTECWQYQQPEDVYMRLRELAEKGVCSDCGKYRPGLYTISAPIFSRAGEVLGAVTILGFSQDFEGERRTELCTQLLRVSSGCNLLIRGGEDFAAKVSA